VHGAPPHSVLSDGSIRRLVAAGRLVIDPWDPANVQPASVDLRLGDSFRVFHNHRASAIDLRDPPTNLTEEVVVAPNEPFVIHPGEFVLGRTEEWVELPDDVVARIEGKALAVDTPVPTPNGWTTMGALKPGDRVFDELGSPTTVVATSEVLSGRECRELVFSEGTRIVADLDHQWEVMTKTDRTRGRGPRILTTRQLERRLQTGVAKREYNHHVLTVDQRRALLEGLMDTDGYVDAYGRCELTTTRRHLAEQYREIVASLGFKPVVAIKTATISGRACGLKYDVTFTPHRPVFRLPRKLARQKVVGRFKLDRAIVDVRPTTSVPVRCIEVATRSGLFLVSRAFIPTHNSSLGRLGLIVHATAGFCDPGWKGTLTLELTNLTRVPIKLYAGLLIAQLSFMALDAAAQRPYGSPALRSHYQGQVAATESRYGR
jgi:deoxycytidine triphosphate deaminase